VVWPGRRPGPQHHRVLAELPGRNRLPEGGGWRENSLTIRITDDGKEVYAVKGHWETVFARWQNTLDIAEFNPIATGCAVRAVDLTTGEQLWRSHLKGSSCREHSKYRNQVTIETDGKVLVIRGNESYSRYLEYVDLKTGKTLGHHEYKDRW
jgi:outer membrane protein assembly factor BamB